MPTPDYSTETLDRIKKLERIKSLGVNPFATKFDITDSIGNILSKNPSNISLDDGATSPFRAIEEIIPAPKIEAALAGRVMLHRSFGKICFASISDGTGRIQILFSRENCSINVDGEVLSLLEKGGAEERSGGLAVSGTLIPPTPLSQGGDETITAYKFAEKLIDLGDFIGIK